MVCELVNGGETGVNATLTADIDMKDIAWTPITSTGLYYSNTYATSYGDADTGYAGVFDGNYHMIKNLSVTAIFGFNTTGYMSIRQQAYTVVNSNEMNREIVGYAMPLWQIAVIVLDCVAAVGIGVWGFFAIRKFLKLNKQRQEEVRKEQEE